MPGTLEYLGSKTVGEALPLLLEASAQLSASIGLMLPQIAAQVAGILAIQVGVSLTPPSIGLTLSMAESLVVNLKAAIEVGVPGLDFQIAAVAQLLVSLSATLASLAATLSFGLNLSLLLGGVGVFAYAYEGTADSLGPSITEATGTGLPGGSGGDPCQAILLVTQTPATWTALKALFGV
jgi:hypothetical protein